MFKWRGPLSFLFRLCAAELQALSGNFLLPPILSLSPQCVVPGELVCECGWLYSALGVCYHRGLRGSGCVQVLIKTEGIRPVYRLTLGMLRE